MSEDTDKLYRLADIPDIDLKRMPTGIPEVDNIFGKSTVKGKDGEPDREVFGLPAGMITYWAGKAGVGKTRMIIAICHAANAMGADIIVGQGEVSPAEFKQWMKQKPERPHTWFVTDSRNPEFLFKCVLKHKPHLLVIDSANMLEGFGTAKEIKELWPRFSAVIKEAGTHCILVGQLNQDGSVKGPSEAGHLVNAVLSIHDLAPKGGRATPGVFHLNMEKNRTGPSGGWVEFKHEEAGVVVHKDGLGVPRASLFNDINPETQCLELNDFGRETYGPSLFPVEYAAWKARRDGTGEFLSTEEVIIKARNAGVPPYLIEMAEQGLIYYYAAQLIHEGRQSLEEAKSFKVMCDNTPRVYVPPVDEYVAPQSGLFGWIANLFG